MAVLTPAQHSLKLMRARSASSTTVGWAGWDDLARAQFAARKFLVDGRTSSTSHRPGRRIRA